jgi:hypothetical protein
LGSLEIATIIERCDFKSNCRKYFLGVSFKYVRITHVHIASERCVFALF